MSTPTLPAPKLPAELALEIAAVARIQSVEKILEVVCRTTGLGFSAVARVTESHWIACAVRDEIGFGLKPGGELEIRTTICDEIRQSGELVVIDHVAEDPAFCTHHTPRQYGFQSYISVPIRLTNGQFFGTLCAIDPRPAKVKTPEIISMFQLFAELIAQHLDAHDRIAITQANLSNELETAQLRDQFIAVLGHDLRNPLAAISYSAAALKTMNLPDDAHQVLGTIDRSVNRIFSLIAHVMDFARGRLGGGLHLALAPDPNLASTLDHVVAELRAANPTRTIHSNINIPASISCDPPRLAQLLSNLLANALYHGTPNTPVSVQAHTTPQHLELSVTNQGNPISPQTFKRLFQPFTRGSDDRHQQGLGLGLYIANQIARAHNATLDATSAQGTTRFTFRMPL